MSRYSGYSNERLIDSYKKYLYRKNENTDYEKNNISLIESEILNRMSSPYNKGGKKKINRGQCSDCYREFTETEPIIVLEKLKFCEECYEIEKEIAFTLNV